MKKLFPYQIDGVEFLRNKNYALLADEMGLGKSAQSIKACDALGLDRIFVVCPATPRHQWKREFSEFSDKVRDFRILTDGKVPFPTTGSVITSYEIAVKKQSEWNRQFFDAVIFDEAHYLKSKDAKRTKVLMGTTGLVRRARYVWALTGTPMPNHPGELWVLLYTFGATQLTYWNFIERFCRFAPGCGIGSGAMQIIGANPHTIGELKSLVKKVALRRTKAQVLKDLPPIFYNTVVVEPGKVELPEEEMQKVEAQLGLLAGEELTIEMLEALAGSVSTLRRYVGLKKVESVCAMIEEELESRHYEKIVIFAIHKQVVKTLEEALARFGVVVITGDTPSGKRDEAVKRFQNDQLVRVFIGNIQAAGTAITLTASSQVMFVEQDWVPGNNAQAAMRCHRIGQKSSVNVRFAALADSLDEKIVGILRRKSHDIKAILD